MTDLPPIEDWWPKLPAELKHQVLEDLEAPLAPAVVSKITGNANDTDTGRIRLSGAERGFIRTQVEPVD